MKRLGKKRKHPTKAVTSKNKIASESVKKTNLKQINLQIDESISQNITQVNTQDKLNELAKNKQGLEKLKKYVDSESSYDSIKFIPIILRQMKNILFKLTFNTIWTYKIINLITFFLIYSTTFWMKPTITFIAFNI